MLAICCLLTLQVSASLVNIVEHLAAKEPDNFLMSGGDQKQS